LHSAERKIYSYTRRRNFLLVHLRTASPTRRTGHTHLISRFLFFHLFFSGFFARRCNHLCLPLSIHHLPIPDVIRAHCSLLVLIIRHLSFTLSSLLLAERERERERERNGSKQERGRRYFLLIRLLIKHCQMVQSCTITVLDFY